MVRKDNTFGALLALVAVVLLVISCAPAAAPPPAPAKEAPIEKAAAPTSAPAKAAPAEKAATPATEPPKAAPAEKAAEPAPVKGAPLPSMLTMATHGVGTGFHAQGTGMAKVLTEAGPIRVVVQPFTGPPAWLPGMNDDANPPFGLVNAVEAWQAYTGKLSPAPYPEGIQIPQTYKQPLSKMRALVFGSNLFVGMIVRKDSPYKTVAETKGLKWTWGFAAFPANQMTTAVALVLAGLSVNDVQKIAVADSVTAQQALLDGRVDAAAGAPGQAFLAEVDAKIGIRYLQQTPVSPAALKTAQGIMPGGGVYKVKAGQPGLKEDTDIWGYGWAIVSSTQMSDETAYTLVKNLWDNNDKIRPLHSNLTDWTKDIFVSKYATAPYHPGAIKFYKEKGVWTQEMDNNQELLLKGELPFLK